MRLLRYLRSLRLTIALIICLGSIFLIGLLVPQKALVGRELYIEWAAEKPGLVSFLDTLRLTDIYTSPFTIAVWTVFFLNLVAVMSDRIPLIWRRYSRVDLPAGIEAIKGGRYFSEVSGSGAAAAGPLKTRGYSIYSGDGSFLAVKNRFAPLATILFHMSFFLILVGAMTVFYTRFVGEVALGEGEIFTGEFRDAIPAVIGDTPVTRIAVEDVRPTYYKKDLPVGLDVDIMTPAGRKTIGINRPYREGPVLFVIKTIDVAPLFIIRGADGRELDGAYVKLNALAGTEDMFSGILDAVMT